MRIARGPLLAHTLGPAAVSPMTTCADATSQQPMLQPCSSAAVSCAGASPWPFVVPIVLSFDMFVEFDGIFDAIVLSVAMDLANALFLARPCTSTARQRG